MKIIKVEFDRSSPDLASCPQSLRPDFAFIGRSNVGKSSLINALTRKKDLAKVSDLPGKTKLLNFFVINNAWHLVDLPGYGFAKVTKDQRADFNESVADYLDNRENLLCVFVLIDSNLPPQRIDLQFLEWLGSTGTPFVLVFTKADKQSAVKAQANIELFKKEITPWWPDELPGIIVTSSKTGDGRNDILAVIAETLKSKNYRTGG
ncbi:YihA family ribosome biogenesis GTP-binding protein [Nibricoccus aquaticus]|uniref:Probable GTP-binding protein EngB n=1 Tax=Nibricoccus aquaticus TaxID=2576891 RepID=A0A290QFD3_9BACT|nr:ribosome biogenesis GTP-binding protein YihA/YsxC [Nibricoccus aquaticus]ATC65950.1 YihA family ribosome biogenesis GTP-binding protein [Nibricoccus aquaticus]